MARRINSDSFFGTLLSQELLSFLKRRKIKKKGVYNRKKNFVETIQPFFFKEILFLNARNAVQSWNSPFVFILSLRFLQSSSNKQREMGGHSRRRRGGHHHQVFQYVKREKRIKEKLNIFSQRKCGRFPQTKYENRQVVFQELR